jgi:hypothetical protein
MVHTFARGLSCLVPISFSSCTARRIDLRSRSPGAAEARSLPVPLRTAHRSLRRCRLVADDEACVESIGKEIR